MGSVQKFEYKRPRICTKNQLKLISLERISLLLLNLGCKWK